MANTLNLGNGNWATKEDSLLAYNSENGNFKPLPFDFTRASSGTVVNKDGLVETIGSGEPRIDFKDNTKGALLLEPERTNLLIHSNDFSKSEWNKQAIGTASLPVVTSNYGISPDGTQNADRLQLNLNGGTTASDLSYMTDYLTATGTTTTSSVYIKSLNSITNIGIRTGSVIKSIDVGTEWQRFDVSDLTSSNRFQFLLYGHLNSQSADLLIYGAQTEQGSYATSYIPTSGSAVTRVADATIGNLPSSSIGQSEGVVYFEGSYLDTSEQGYIQISDGTSDNRIIIWNLTSTLLRGYIVVGGAEQAQITGGIISNNTTFKVALKYKTNDFALWFNGVEVGVDPFGSTFGSNVLNKLDLQISSVVFEGEVKDLKLYNTALTNAELQALTTI